MAGTTLGTAYIQIAPSAKGIKGSITDALSGEAEAAGKSTGASIATFAKKAIKVAAIGTVIKSALEEGANLQQSYFGGLDTLYGDAADAAREYAREAAAAGVSMNEYSEQAVSFGSALKQAFGGDATKAVEAANTAIMDMTDNAAKMGTPLESIQTAYQGFAKQNYTMLDNLKLGYGGTKQEMERLLADAEALTGKEYNIDNLGDVYEAIHVIQGELGLTGVAAQEASETFSGSFSAMMASAKNLLGSLAIGENVGPAMTQFATSVSTFFFGNFVPMIGTLIKSLPPAIVAFVKVGIPQMLNGINGVLSSLAASLKSKADGITGEKVSAWATTTLPKILKAAGTIIKNFAKGLITNLPSIIASLGKIGAAIIKGLGSSLWGKVKAAAETIRNKFMEPINSIRDKVKAALDKVKGLFPIQLGKIFSGIQLPHFNISGGEAPWGIGGKGVKPSISIDWYAKGGIFDSAHLIGIGEAGPEAIIPLTPFWDKLDKALETRSAGDITINVYATDSKSAKEIAREVKNELIRETNGRRLAWQ